MKWLERFDDLLNRMEGGLIIVFLTVMVLLAFLQVVLRNVFSAGILWGDVLLRHLVLWIGFLGAALAASKDRHINIDVLTRFLSKTARAAIDVFTDLFAAFICFVLCRAGLTFLSNEIAEQNKVFAEIPAWYAESIIPVGFGLLTIHFLLRAILNGRAALKGGQGE